MYDVESQRDTLRCPICLVESGYFFHRGTNWVVASMRFWQPKPQTRRGGSREVREPGCRETSPDTPRNVDPRTRQESLRQTARMNCVFKRTRFLVRQLVSLGVMRVGDCPGGGNNVIFSTPTHQPSTEILVRNGSAAPRTTFRRRTHVNVVYAGPNGAAW